MSQLFNNYSSYLKDKYHKTVYRVAVDAGFSCPNRGADRASPGCSYCDEYGSRAPYLGKAAGIEEQIQGSIGFLKKRYRAQEFILYFQAFSGTYAPREKLSDLYSHALSLYPFKELIVSTRPDCVDRGVVALLSGYKSQVEDVWVELGLQSSHDRTLVRINRGHSVQDFASAYSELKKGGIKVAVHLIFGLPGECWRDIEETVRYVSRLHPDGIKIHNLHVGYHTALFREYLQGELVVLHPARHLDYCVRALELLPPQTVVMRLTCDTSADRLAAPRRFWPKAQFYERIKWELRSRNTCQGRCFSEPS